MLDILLFGCVKYHDEYLAEDQQFGAWVDAAYLLSVPSVDALDDLVLP